MRIQDVGLWVGIFLITVGAVYAVLIEAGISIGIDFSKFPIPYLEQLPYISIGVGIFLAVISLVSLAKTKND
ncbi:MAG: hypothetical protein R3321_11910 [Nitrososphaeraceae archaeon]|nr:hypothetical protein [Nitrososphaeraceae archaeon]